VDINVVPLEEDNPFCQAKSENKFVEAGLVGVPTVASPVEAFRHAVGNGEDGLLVSTTDEWKVALATLLENPDGRREMGEAARRKVYAHYTPEKRASELSDTMQRIVDQHCSAPVPAREILREWANRMELYARAMREDARELEAQVESLRLLLGQYEKRLSDNMQKKDRLIDHQRRVIGEKNQIIERKLEAIDRCREVVRKKEMVIEEHERTIDDIMQGRVMRSMTTLQRWLDRIRGSDSS
jgi:hypothetical protein